MMGKPIWHKAVAFLRHSLFVVLSAAATSAIAQTQVFYPWYYQGWEARSEFEGWSANVVGSAINIAQSGGNPGRYVQSTTTTGIAGFMVAQAGAFSGNVPPAGLMGNYAAAGTNEISVDLSYIATVSQAWFRVRTSPVGDFNGWRFPIALSAPSAWTTYTFRFDPNWTDAQARTAGWVQDAAPVKSFSQTMAQVDFVELRFEGVSTGAAIAVDNIRRSGSIPSPLVWSQLQQPTPQPASRGTHTAVYDAAHDRMIVFGGGTGNWTVTPTLLNDVWILSGASGRPTGSTPQWTSLTPASPPSARGYHAAVYDPAANSMIVYGGDTAISFCGGAVNDVWVLNNANGLDETAPLWRQVSPAVGADGPAKPRQHARAVYDTANSRLVVFGGLEASCGGAQNNDVWVLDDALGATGGPGPRWYKPSTTTSGPQTIMHGLAYDQATGRMIAFGGQDAAGYSKKVWVLTNAATIGDETRNWLDITPAVDGPPARVLHSAVYDQNTNELTVFGGSSTADNAGANDTWILSNANGVGVPAWRRVGTADPLPAKRQGQSAVYDFGSRRMTVYGGIVFTAPSYLPTNDIWVLADVAATAPAVDTIAPTTVATIDPPPANGWNRGTATVALNATDLGGSGVKSITYTIGGIEPVPVTVLGATATFQVSSAGTTGISYFATDNANNQEQTKNLLVKIDTVSPTTQSATTPALVGDKTSVTPVTVNLSATDNEGGSGVALISYDSTVGTGGASSSTLSFQVSGEGTHDVIYSATDTAGNYESDKHLTVRIGRDTDGDGIADVDDNCPYKANPDQSPAACANDYKEALVVPAGTKQPGEPLWATATFTNTSGADILTFQPDCINTIFEVKDGEGNVVPPIYRERFYVIPRDVVKIAAGEQFSVSCDVSQLVQASRLSAAAYSVQATYGNHASDPDGVVNLWIGAVQSPQQQIVISGSPVETNMAKAMFTPSTWLVQWASFDGDSISAAIDFTGSGHAPNDFDAATIRLNGSVPIEGAATVNGNVMTVHFDRLAAVRSIGSAVSGSRIAPTIQGSNTSKARFFIAQGPVTLAAAIQVGVDIKPGSAQNTINLGSNGVVPVAILSSATFDARDVNVMSVTLAGAHVKLKGKGTPQYSIQDVNGDGRPDLVVNVSTDALQLTDSDTTAVVEGITNAGVPIIGSDLVRIVP